jgi:hypothetical protein
MPLLSGLHIPLSIALSFFISYANFIFSMLLLFAIIILLLLEEIIFSNSYIFAYPSYPNEHKYLLSSENEISNT